MAQRPLLPLFFPILHLNRKQGLSCLEWSTSLSAALVYLLVSSFCNNVVIFCPFKCSFFTTIGPFAAGMSQLPGPCSSREGPFLVAAAPGQSSIALGKA